MTGECGLGSTVRSQRSDAQRNKQKLAAAAVTAIHREGLRVPMTTIAEDAGVGIGTLYRHFPTRDDLLSHLTRHSLERVLVNAHEADRLGDTPIDALRRFVDASIRQRNELVLPLDGRSPLSSLATLPLRSEVNLALQEVIDRGRANATLKYDLQAQDVLAFAALLAQPHRPDAAWDDLCRRILESYLHGLQASPR